jgi:hypothetical protein
VRAFALVSTLVIALAIRAIAHWGRVDIDNDAYGHFVVARRALDAPTDLSVHWVWLPGWHVVHALFDWLGLGFQAVRAFSLACSLSTIASLFLWVEREQREVQGDRDELSLGPWFAAAIAALALAVARPAIDAGGSAEPEALFSLLIVGAVASLRASRPVTAGALASIAALTRYEAWPFVLALFVIERMDARSSDVPAYRRALAWLMPASAIVAWCVAHRLQSGEWLAFIRENRAFVARSLPRLFTELPAWPRRAAWYPVTLPWATWGAPPLALAFLGAVIVTRARRWALLVPPAVLLGFLTYSWLRAQHLGLVRHAVAYLPFYAAAMGVGAAGVARVWRSRIARPWFAAAALALALALCSRGWGAALEHRAIAARALIDEQGAAAVLRREAGDRATIFSDRAIVEALSGLDRSRFIRWNVADVRPYNLTDARQSRGAVWVVSRPDRVRALLAVSESRYESPTIVVLVSR